MEGEWRRRRIVKQVTVNIIKHERQKIAKGYSLSVLYPKCLRPKLKWFRFCNTCFCIRYLRVGSKYNMNFIAVAHIA